MNQALADLIKISRAVGRDSSLVQGGGGNTSVKTPDGKYMYIKASGTALKDMDERRGWRRLELGRVRAIMADQELPALTPEKVQAEVLHRLLQACDDAVAGGARPSVESMLHALLGRVVIHLHPWAVGAFVNARAGKERLARLFADEKHPPLWVPYFDPGVTLARALSGRVAAYRARYGDLPAVIFLARHGLIISAGNAAGALRLVRRVIRKCNAGIKPARTANVKRPSAQAVRKAKLTLRRGVFEATGRYVVVRHVLDGEIAAFMGRQDVKRLLAAPALTPDELLYAGGAPVWLDRVEARRVAAKIKRLTEGGRRIVATFLVRRLGLFVAAEPRMTSIVAEVTAGTLFVRAAAAAMGGVRGLSRRERDFINNWEAERFRQQVLTGGQRHVLQDRIVVVTGAGSGLGRSIALGMARAGALVAAADIDTTAAEETCALIKAERADAAVLSLSCDVTDEDSVERGYAALLGEWGGLDVLVNAAGVAPAYGLVDLPVGQWRLALEVNLTGYFLMAREAARIMIEQGMGGNIINISSKSGLEASRNNTPYNATKAGELHMARGWAIELGSHGIRVNCVCPGNVFEGSKIWNPEYIRVCAKKYGIKPEEVIPYYVNKTILKRQIKGQDIANAVVFLCSEQARTITGQIIVADSGQVMVR